ncbi:unnamed protein product [Periconia digitata]|uniref:DUF1531-domain-containing protein n=1 Tax=Periconia digitata TaxID=1303443 RepID=A0A9W4XKQ2_9PLEO|nr:unnamed protein product [Periconia digitata]
MDQLAELPGLLNTWKDNFFRNSKSAFTTMDTRAWIRLVMIVGTYCLIRPYLVKMAGRHQQRQHEKANANNDAAAEGMIDPRTGRRVEAANVNAKGKVAIPGVGDESDEEVEVGGVSWGKSARVRQRKFIRTAVEREERRLEEEDAESDKEIEELLVG